MVKDQHHHVFFLKEAVGGSDHEGHDDVDVESGGGGDGEKKKRG